MGKIRRCDSRCHKAKGTRCRCWCGGFFHGVDGTGAANRAALTLDTTVILRQHGYKEGETAYIEQKMLPLGD